MLDSDFIIKSWKIQKDSASPLCAVFFRLPYRYVCHDQVKTEINRGNGGGECQWFTDSVSTDVISVYSDKELITLLKEAYSYSSFYTAFCHYASLLKTSCAPFSKYIYSKYDFSSLNENSSPDEIINTIQIGDKETGNDSHLGEIKSLVLIQILQLVTNKTVFLFCSDDRPARNTLKAELPENTFSCLSILGVFWLIKEKHLLSQTESEYYFTSFLQLHAGQSTFKIKDGSLAGNDIFHRIWDNTLILRADGLLENHHV